MTARSFQSVTLDVAYHGSPVPQTIDVRARFSGPAELPRAAWAVGAWVASANRGLAGGSEFSPLEGSAKLLAGPTGKSSDAKDASNRRADLAWQIEARSVSPKFFRTLADYFHAAGAPSALVELSIAGSARAASDPSLTLRENTLGAWLADTTTYLGAFGSPPFVVNATRAPRGATIRVELVNAAPNEIGAIEAEFARTISAWQNVVLPLPNARKNGLGVMDPQCKLARTNHALFARAQLFDHARAPARAALVNALAWFHERVAKIRRVDLALA